MQTFIYFSSPSASDIGFAYPMSLGAKPQVDDSISWVVTCRGCVCYLPIRLPGQLTSSLNRINNLETRIKKLLKNCVLRLCTICASETSPVRLTPWEQGPWTLPVDLEPWTLNLSCALLDSLDQMSHSWSLVTSYCMDHPVDL
jgi:hypothetical protein